MSLTSRSISLSLSLSLYQAMQRGLPRPSATQERLLPLLAPPSLALLPSSVRRLSSSRRDLSFGQRQKSGALTNRQGKRTEPEITFSVASVSLLISPQHGLFFFWAVSVLFLSHMSPIPLFEPLLPAAQRVRVPSPPMTVGLWILSSHRPLRREERNQCTPFLSDLSLSLSLNRCLFLPFTSSSRYLLFANDSDLLARRRAGTGRDRRRC